MIFVGTLEIVFNKPLSNEMLKDVENLVEFLNRDYLKRGAKRPEDAATIKEYSISSNIISMRIETGSRVRPDEASLRIKNAFAN
ncbi:MAG: hypothetical protein QXO28_05970, partial [Ignisphaera sp.]